MVFLFVPPMHVLGRGIDLLSRLHFTGATSFVFADVQLCSLRQLSKTPLGSALKVDPVFMEGNLIR